MIVCQGKVVDDTINMNSSRDTTRTCSYISRSESVHSGLAGDAKHVTTMLLGYGPNGAMGDGLGTDSLNHF
jgi:hypothetical protein